MILQQTWAMTVEAYRELNAKKLFWIVLILSGLVVGIIGGIGLNPTGVSIFGFEFENPAVNSSVTDPAVYYKGLFVSVGIPIWLTWAATILGLVSTASIFPEMISGGTIEMMLSKPISRARVFMTKYLLALMFMALQVSVFSAGAFLVIGTRGKEWVPELFLAVPIVLLFFSYLYCVCVLIGLLTRSTIAALLLTMVFWLFLFLMNTADGAMVFFKAGTAEVVVKQQAEVQETQQLIDRLEQAGDVPPPVGLVDAFVKNLDTSTRIPVSEEERQAQLTAARERLVLSQEELEQATATASTVAFWQGVVESARFVLPKTNETIQLLPRWVMSREDLLGSFDDSSNNDGPFTEETNRATREEFLNRSPAMIIATSLGFELVVLGACLFIFTRRDY